MAVGKQYRNKQTCSDGTRDHDFHVARIRGSRTRSQCRKCMTMTPWEKTKTVAPPVQEQRTTGPVLPTASELDSHTVPELRNLAKESGIAGYSKMNKADLIGALTTQV